MLPRRPMPLPSVQAALVLALLDSGAIFGKAAPPAPRSNYGPRGKKGSRKFKKNR